MASRAGFWEKSLLSYSWQCTVLPCSSPVSWKNTCVYKTANSMSTLKVDHLFGCLLFRGRELHGCSSFPQQRSKSLLHPEFQEGFCQSWVGDFIFICMGRRVRLERYLVVPLVLFQSYFGTFWKNNKMTVAATQAADFSRLLVYLTAESIWLIT